MSNNHNKDESKMTLTETLIIGLQWFIVIAIIVAGGYCMAITDTGPADAVQREKVKEVNKFAEMLQASEAFQELQRKVTYLEYLQKVGPAKNFK